MTVEPLEDRRMLTLLGVVPSFPLTTYDSTGVINYNPTNDIFRMTGTPLTFRASATSPPQTYSALNGLTLQIDVDNSGNLLSDGSGDDFSIVGTINGSPSFSGTLLTGKVIDFGSLYTGSSTNSFDFVAIPTGGMLFSDFAGKDIGITSSSENSTFTGSFSSAFTGGAKGSIGTVAAPTITTLASPNVMLSDATRTLTDTAVLNGTYAPTGSVTFTLTDNGNAVAGATQTDPVSGNGTYSASYTLPTSGTVAGTYAWTATYGINGNTVATDNGANETTVVSPASPTVSTVSSANVMLSDGTTVLTDTADLEGAFNPSGSITFTLTLNGNAVAGATQTDTVTGDGTYGASYELPTSGTVAGTYLWSAMYSGDDNNQSANDNGTNETTVASPAAPALTTTASTNAMLGNGTTVLTDMADLEGAYNPTGTITFTLTLNGNAVAGATQTDTVTGDGTYTANYTLPSSGTVAGAYLWLATYNGDSNNQSATDDGTNETTSVSDAAPIISTTASSNVMLGNGATTLSDSADLEGAYDPTGTITFTLTLNGNTVAGATQTDTVTANGTYGASYALPTTGTVVGTYLWAATYNGDGNNQAAVDNGANESTVVSAAAPTISTTASSNVTLGNGTTILTDSADLEGAYNPTGTITFTLTLNGNAVAGATQTDTVTGDGVYHASYTLSTSPTVAGTYLWLATYNGDGNNKTAIDNGANETTVVTCASPTVATVASGNVTLGNSSTTLTDTATLAGAYKPTGTITFTLTLNGNAVAGATQTDTVTGDGVYHASYTLPTSPTVAGTYLWLATYNGDGNNQKAYDNGANESTVVYADTPTITTNQGPTVILGSGNALTDSATLSAGYSPTGSITFALYLPTDTGYSSPVYSKIVTVSGDGTYGGSSVVSYTPPSNTAAGTYQWVATYTSGNGNNLTVNSGKGKEPEAVMSPITISGIKYSDCTGNGFSSDDTGLGGVTIYLYTSTTGLGTGSGYFEKTTTGSNGAYSFTNLAPGTYYVQEAVPAGYIQTGGGPNGSTGNTYYTISGTSGQTFSGMNFDDYLIPTCTPTNVSYTVYNSSCQAKTVSTLGGNTQQGYIVSVSFTVTPGMSDQLTLISYTAPGPTFSDSTAYQQQIYDESTGTFGPGTYTLYVAIPNCYYQIDFVCGPAINVLEPQTYNGSAYGPDSANVLYHAEDRYISSDNSGTNACSTSKQVASGDYAMCSFWSTSNGQNLINSCNGSSSSTRLGQWLCQQFPNLFGSGGCMCMMNSNGSYYMNSQIAQAYGKCSSTNQQILSSALSIYCTSINLCGSSAGSLALKYGLNTSGTGEGGDNYSVGSNGSAFGVSNNCQLSVLQLLQNLNSCTAHGSNPSSGACSVFSSINSAGRVTNALGDGSTAYDPNQVRTAYGINDLSLDGSGQTIAIVDAYNNPQIYQSLDTFDAEFSATTGGASLLQQYGSASSFLTVIGQDGSTADLPTTDPSGAGTDNWELEEALDVEWAHAIAPGAQIVVIEANTQSLADLMSSVVTAANLPRVSVVSMSWGFTEGQSVTAADEALYDAYLTTPAGHQGVTFVASTGDFGTNDPEYPAFSPNVLAVGGTSLNLNADNSYNSETGWGGYSTDSNGNTTLEGSGGGTSMFEAEPAYQYLVQTTGYRSTPDVSFIANPNTGVWVSDTYNASTSDSWDVVGGTSLAAPAWAGLIADVNQGRVLAGEATLNSNGPNEVQQAIYSLPANDYNSITSGSNGGYNASAGYNFVTGLGTPIANRLMPGLVAYQGGGAATNAPMPVFTGAIPMNGAAGSYSVSDAIMVSRGGEFGPRSDSANVAASTAPTSVFAGALDSTVASSFSANASAINLLSPTTALASAPLTDAMTPRLSFAATVFLPVGGSLFTTGSSSGDIASRGDSSDTASVADPLDTVCGGWALKLDDFLATDDGAALLRWTAQASNHASGRTTANTTPANEMAFDRAVQHGSMAVDRSHDRSIIISDNGSPQATNANGIGLSHHDAADASGRSKFLAIPAVVGLLMQQLGANDESKQFEPAARRAKDKSLRR